MKAIDNKDIRCFPLGSREGNPELPPVSVHLGLGGGFRKR